MTSTRVLLLGIGNPGRGDDGLGPALAAYVERLAIAGVEVDADYQLAPEHAAAMLHRDLVVVADACVTGPEGFHFERVEPRHDLPFSSHGLEPPQVVGLAEAIAERTVECYLLGIRGYEFEPFSESLSHGARCNLQQALDFILPVLRNAVVHPPAECQPNLYANCEGAT